MIEMARFVVSPSKHTTGNFYQTVSSHAESSVTKAFLPGVLNVLARSVHDYRHIIHSLSPKPQAFRFLQFRDELLPIDIYRQLWQQCDQQFQPRDACKWIVGVLRIAMDHDCEERLGNELVARVDNNQPLPTLKVLQERYLGKKSMPIIPARQQDLASYDHLLPGNWHRTEAVSHA